jgi:hypothetical protein
VRHVAGREHRAQAVATGISVWQRSQTPKHPDFNPGLRSVDFGQLLSLADRKAGQ